MMLADSRSVDRSDRENINRYEWFCIDGVGSYLNDRLRYSYSESGYIEALDSENKAVILRFPDNCYVRPGAGAIEEHPELDLMYVPIRDHGGENEPYGTVYAFSVFYDGENEYHLPEGEQLYLVYDRESGAFSPVLSSEERCGGEFSPACCIAEFRERLFFGTDSGDICVFNTDKRGIAEHYGDSENDREAVGVSEIHSRWYDRCGHRYTSGFSTLSDNCGFPQFTKSTVGKTLVIKAKRLRNGSFTVSARTDRDDWTETDSFTVSENTFYQTDFSNLSFEDRPRVILASREKLKGWCEKQLYLFSDGFRRPFGIYGLAYCYTVAGRVK